MPDRKPVVTGSSSDFERRTDFFYLASGFFVLFRIGDHELGVPTRHIQETISFCDLPELPAIPASDVVIGGIPLGVTVRVNGRNMRVRDLRRSLSAGRAENRKENCILLRHASRMHRVPEVEGIIVDDVHGTHDLSKEKIEPFDGQGTSFPPLCLLGRVHFEGRPRLLLHLDRLLEHYSDAPGRPQP
jgi:chemotaxis signal transduction protein